MLRRSSDSDGKRQRDAPHIILSPDQILQCAANDIGAHLRTAYRSLGKDQDEFISSIPAGNIFTPGVRLQEFTELAQHRVTGKMAISAVELLKSVHIEHENADGQLRPGSSGERALP